jgi:DNA-binding NarL/FixJ family response regulator
MAREYTELEAGTRRSLPRDHRISTIVVGDEFSRSGLKSILQSEERIAEVIEAASFDEAIEKLSKRRDVGLAILDLQMAEKIETIRKHFPTTRVVVVSDSSERDNVLAVLGKGAHGYIPKRLGIAEFRRALAMVLNRIIYVPSSISDLHQAQDCSPANESACEIGHLPAARGRSSCELPLAEPVLTPRQSQVLKLLTQGMSNKEICRALKLGEGTVKIHVAGIFRALQVKSRTAAAVIGANLPNGELRKRLPTEAALAPRF